MNLSILNEFQSIAEELQRNMSPHVLEHLAKEKGFVHRKCKYQAQAGVTLLCLSKKKGWVVPPPLHVRNSDQAQ